MIEDKVISDIIRNYEKKEELTNDEIERFEMAKELLKRRDIEQDSVCHDLSNLTVGVKGRLNVVSLGYHMDIVEVTRLFCEMLLTPHEARAIYDKKTGRKH